jgi:hypothetical protein
MDKVCSKRKGAYHEGMQFRVGMVQHILNLSTTWKEVATSTPLLLLSLINSFWYPLIGRLNVRQSQSAQLGKEKNPFS